MRQYIFIIIVGLLMLASPVESARNVVLDVEEDRKMEKSQNIIFVEPESKYKAKKIEELQSKCEKLEVDVKELSQIVKNIQDMVNELQNKLEGVIQSKR